MGQPLVVPLEIQWQLLPINQLNRQTAYGGLSHFTPFNLSIADLYIIILPTVYVGRITVYKR
jgi:hypothetical protein